MGDSTSIEVPDEPAFDARWWATFNAALIAVHYRGAQHGEVVCLAKDLAESAHGFTASDWDKRYG